MGPRAEYGAPWHARGRGALHGRVEHLQRVGCRRVLVGKRERAPRQCRRDDIEQQRRRVFTGRSNADTGGIKDAEDYRTALLSASPQVSFICVGGI